MRLPGNARFVLRAESGQAEDDIDDSPGGGGYENARIAQGAARQSLDRRETRLKREAEDGTHHAGDGARGADDPQIRAPVPQRVRGRAPKARQHREEDEPRRADAAL